MSPPKFASRREMTKPERGRENDNHILTSCVLQGDINNQREIPMFIFANPEMLPEQRLWASLIDQLMRDAFKLKRNARHSDYNSVQHVIDQAHSWFNIHSKDFVMVCDMAGYDPGFVMREYQKEQQRTGRGNWRDIKTVRKHLQQIGVATMLAMTVSACATQKPAPLQGDVMIPDIKACIAEYDEPGFIGTRAEYVAGCYRFAAVRF